MTPSASAPDPASSGTHPHHSSWDPPILDCCFPKNQTSFFIFVLRIPFQNSFDRVSLSPDRLSFCAADTARECLCWKRGHESQGVHYRPEVLLCGHDLTEDGNYCVQLMCMGWLVCLFLFITLVSVETMNRLSNAICYVPFFLYSVVYMPYEMEIYLDVMTK